MDRPEKQIVRAFIPSIDNPDARVLHITGTEPIEVGEIALGQENLLHIMGKRVLSDGYLAIDFQKSRRDIDSPVRRTVVNVAEIQTKPIDRSQIDLGDDYVWSDR